MTIEIKSWRGVVLHRSEKSTLLEALREALQGGAVLRDAVLRGADLRGADLSGAVLRDAVLRDADLSGAVLSGADLRGADLSGADLRGAVLRDAVLRDADLSGADLRDADLRGAVLRDADLSGADLRGAVLRDAVLRDADLSGADLRDADLTPIQLDVEAICAAAPAEVPALLAAIREGRMDGSHYEGTCACLLGTIANSRRVHYTQIPGLEPDSTRPAEAFATAVKRGDTPATNQVSALLDEWIAAWLARQPKAEAAP